MKKILFILSLLISSVQTECMFRLGKLALGKIGLAAGISTGAVYGGIKKSSCEPNQLNKEKKVSRLSKLNDFEKEKFISERGYPSFFSPLFGHREQETTRKEFIDSLETQELVTEHYLFERVYNNNAFNVNDSTRLAMAKTGESMLAFLQCYKKGVQDKVSLEKNLAVICGSKAIDEAAESDDTLCDISDDMSMNMTVAWLHPFGLRGGETGESGEVYEKIRSELID